MTEQNVFTKKSPFRSPVIFSDYPGLIAAESTRHGGVSSGAYGTLNLGGATQDQPEHVLENNRRFFASLQVPFEQVAKSHQVHGTDILHVTTPGRYEGYDSLITSVTGIQLAVTIADCTPVLLFDPVTKSVAAIHAGWKGTVGLITRKTVVAMRDTFGTDPSDCLAFIGTCIDACSFEVDNDVASHFDDNYKQWDDERRKFFVDLKAANRQQLLEAGLHADHIEISAYSTVLNNDDYFSHRHEKGVTGRMLATIGYWG